jgi:hypothetical protein
MKRLFLLVTVANLLGCGSSGAQTADFEAPPVPGAGTISPLGAIVTTSPIGGTGVALGSTELYGGGLSPAPVDPIAGGTTCPEAVASAGTLGTVNSVPLGVGGTPGAANNPTISPSCGATAGSTVSAGLSSVPGSAAVNSSVITSLGGGIIPLGATQLSSSGLSSPPVVQMPISPGPSCLGATSMVLGTTIGSATAGGSVAAPAPSSSPGC